MQNPSALSMDDYIANYGDRLQSLLGGGTMTTNPAAVGAPGSAQPQAGAAPAAPPQSALQPGQPAQQQPGAPAQGGAGSSFQDKWNDSSEAQQKQATDDLEKQLQQGNKTIDSAYDDLVKQMGQRPAPDEKLTREEKGMFLMEFGLSLMANSSSKGGFNGDTAGAVGASGLAALQGHRARRGRERERYDDNRLDIEKSRAGAKSRLAEQSTLEARSEARDDRRATRENSQLAGTVTGDDGNLYGYTRGGSVSQLERPGGGGVKVLPKTSSSGSKGGGRGFESDKRFSQYMDIYGKDENGAPLEGADLEAVKKRALAFSADPKASTMSDAEMRSMAERSADNFQKSNWAQFRDMKPDEIKAWRDKNAEENFQRLKKGEALSVASPKKKSVGPRGGGSALAGKGSKPARSFASQADVKAAFDNKELQSGDIVVIGNKRFQVP